MEQHKAKAGLTARDALERVRLGAGLGEARREALAAAGEVVTHHSGVTLFREGEKTPYMGVVVSGRLGMRTYVAGRGDVTLSTVEAGDIFGWSVLVPPRRSHATVWAVTDVVLLVFPAEALLAALGRDVDLAAAVYQHTIAALGQRLSATRLQLLDLFEPPAPAEAISPRSALSRRLADVRRPGAQGEIP